MSIANVISPPTVIGNGWGNFPSVDEGYPLTSSAAVAVYNSRMYLIYRRNKVALHQRTHSKSRCESRKTRAWVKVFRESIMIRAEATFGFWYSAIAVYHSDEIDGDRSLGIFAESHLANRHPGTGSVIQVWDDFVILSRVPSRSPVDAHTNTTTSYRTVGALSVDALEFFLLGNR